MRALRMHRHGRTHHLRRGTAAELVAYYEARPPKGEITLVISGMR